MTRVSNRKRQPADQIASSAAGRADFLMVSIVPLMQVQASGFHPPRETHTFSLGFASDTLSVLTMGGGLANTQGGI